MSIMKMNWGARIAILYGGFVAIIVTLVVGSMHQSFDLVSPDYYSQEIKYQQVIDAGKNQAALSSPVSVHADQQNVVIQFPAEFLGKEVTGDIDFYSPVSASLDKHVPIQVSNNAMVIARNTLHTTSYNVKISWRADGKAYYQQTDLTLR